MKAALVLVALVVAGWSFTAYLGVGTATHAKAITAAHLAQIDAQ